MFVLAVGYVDMTTYPLTKYYYIIERVYFIYRLFILFICILSFLMFLYTVLWRYKRDYLHTGIEFLFYIMLYVISTMKKQTLLYHVRNCDIKKVSIWTCPLPQSIICSYAPEKLYFSLNWRILWKCPDCYDLLKVGISLKKRSEDLLLQNLTKQQSIRVSFCKSPLWDLQLTGKHYTDVNIFSDEKKTFMFGHI